jgi:hypothetical protein
VTEAAEVAAGEAAVGRVAAGGGGRHHGEAEQQGPAPVGAVPVGAARLGVQGDPGGQQEATYGLARPASHSATTARALQPASGGGGMDRGPVQCASMEDNQGITIFPVPGALAREAGPAC